MVGEAISPSSPSALPALLAESHSLSQDYDYLQAPQAVPDSLSE